MRNRSLTAECNKIFNFWKLEEYFTPSDYPELTLTIKEGKQDIPFDAYYNAYSTRSLPLKEYKAHNEYLRQKHKSDEKLYNRANVYCGCYKIKTFVEKMAEKCKLDMEKYAEINELSGRFYIFSVQIDLDGKITEEGVQVSPFFYAVLCMIKAEGINVNIMQENIWKLNEEVNEILKQNNVQILEFTDVTIVKNIIFDKLRIESESEVGLKSASDKVTLDLAREDSISWDESIDKFNVAKRKVLLLREGIKKDQKLLDDFYKEGEGLAKSKLDLKQLLIEKEQLNIKLNDVRTELESNEQETLEQEGKIKYIKEHSSIFKKLLILLGIGKIGRHVAEKQKYVDELIINHEDIKRRYSLAVRNTEEVCGKIENQYSIISTLEKKVQILEEKVYGNNESLKNKYKNNFADRNFYEAIKESENSQNACPWTFDEYDMAREELFFASLQVRKAFILESPYIKRNLFVYEAYNNGKYTMEEKKEMFPHLFNSLSIVIPVLSSTFASVGRFLKHAGNMSLGMLIIDESGQAVPQSALGAIYRTRRAVVVGDPLQVEPVVTIPKVLIDILADSTCVANEYKVIENSAQTFADNINEFNGMIGERQVGCPLVVHRRCIEPMFSISNLISYDNRMFNKTNKKEEYLKPEKPFLIKKSGWINVEGVENGGKDHFVKNQAERVCQLMEDAVHIYSDLFETDDKIFIITPFRTVAESMRKFIISYFSAKGYDKEILSKWTKNCVGTVHTFQGKDANEVLLVLGCSNKSAGAMNWVVKKANILNVACTRAKYRIAFIGNINDWKNRRYFREFIPNLIDIINV